MHLLTEDSDCSIYFVINSLLVLSRKKVQLQKQPSRGILKKGVLKICIKFTGKHPCRSADLIQLLCYFIEIALWHGYSPANLLHVFRTPSLLKNTSGWLLLQLVLKTHTY